jgi:hypothetical protein
MYDYRNQPPSQPRSWLQWQAYVHAQIQAGRPPAHLLAELAASGIPQQHAYGLVMGAIEGQRRRAWIIAGVSGAVLAIGVLVTLSTMSEARSSGGGTFLVAFGAIGCGALGVIYGLMQLGRVPRL